MSNLEVIKVLAMTANNVVLKGNFSGDTIHEASELCRWCEKLVEQIVVLEKADDGDTEKAE